MAEMVRCAGMRVAAVTGLSGSGKTTLIEALIRFYVARGERVAAIKHTHHALNGENRGDTARFLAAGAEPVILAGDREAMIWSAAAVLPLPLSFRASSEGPGWVGFHQQEVGTPPAQVPRSTLGMTSFGFETPSLAAFQMALLELVGAVDVVLIEGFKDYDGWPRIEAGCSAPEAAATLDRIWRSS